MSAEVAFTRENLDKCLSRLAKEFRKLNGTKTPAEIILIGGAAILANYGFRDMTYDIDAIINASSSMKDAINKVGDEMKLPNGWLNSDFKKTKSYSPKLLQYSVFYKRFGHVLDVRTVSGDYLVAMKLMSGRRYKNDISDIVGILKEQKENGNPLTLSSIEKAVCNLYGSLEVLPSESKKFIVEIMKDSNFNLLYQKYKSIEKSTKESLLKFEKDYPGVADADNIDDIIKQLNNKKTAPHEK